MSGGRRRRRTRAYLSLRTNPIITGSRPETNYTSSDSGDDNDRISETSSVSQKRNKGQEPDTEPDTDTGNFLLSGKEISHTEVGCLKTDRSRRKREKRREKKDCGIIF